MFRRIEFAWYWKWQAWPFEYGRNRNAVKHLQLAWWFRVGPLEIRQRA